MATYFNYRVIPKHITKPTGQFKIKSKYSLLVFIISLLFVIGIGILIMLIDEVWAKLLGLFGTMLTVGLLIGRKVMNDNKEADQNIKLNQTIRQAESEQSRANHIAESYSRNLNLLLNRSDEIANAILPYYENLAREEIMIGKQDFIENAYSPFWSKIEEACKALACFKEATIQLCKNRELYNGTLKTLYLDHDFPKSFPISITSSISQLINTYDTIIRNAHTNPTFSIIWEQRRNSQILMGGFNTLENAINNLSNDINSAISDLNTSINSLKYIQLKQLETYESNQATLKETFNSMDTKLYYIQWDRKPLDNFRHK